MTYYCLPLRPYSGDAIVLEDQSSSGGENATLAADGDLTTVWEASGNTNEWVTLDLGETREVAGVRLQVRQYLYSLGGALWRKVLISGAPR